MSGTPYYRTEATLAQSDGSHVQLGAGGNLAVEAMMRIVRSSGAYNPIGLFVPWGRQKGGVTWQTLGEPDHDLVLYPIRQADVSQANSQSFGNEVPWVGVLTDVPVDMKLADEVFDPTRYDQFATEGVYLADDAHQAPQIYFLYWAKIHDDVGGGRGSLDAVAARLGGKLVFPLHVAPRAPRTLPSLPFQFVLNAQLAKDTAVPGGITVADVAALGADSGATMTTAPPPGASTRSVALWAGLAAVAGGALWVSRRKSKRRGARA